MKVENIKVASSNTLVIDDQDDVDDKKTRNSDGSTTLTLSEPITHGEEELRELRIRKPTARDLECTDAVQGDVKKANTLLAHLSGQSLAAIRKLSAADTVAAQEVVASYLGKSR